VNSKLGLSLVNTLFGVKELFLDAAFEPTSSVGVYRLGFNAEVLYYAKGFEYAASYSRRPQVGNVWGLIRQLEKNGNLGEFSDSVGHPQAER